MPSSVGEVENSCWRGALQIPQTWEDFTHSFTRCQPPADASEISSQVCWCSCWYMWHLLFPVLKYDHTLQALLVSLLRRSGFNKIASEGELEGSNPNVNFPVPCEYLLTLTLNPRNQPWIADQHGVRASLTPGWALAVCILASTVSAICFQFIDGYWLKRKSDVRPAEQLPLSFLLC